MKLLCNKGCAHVRTDVRLNTNELWVSCLSTAADSAAEYSAMTCAPRLSTPVVNIINIIVHSSCDIEYFVEAHLCKLCVILRSRVLRVVCPH